MEVRAIRGPNTPEFLFKDHNIWLHNVNIFVQLSIGVISLVAYVFFYKISNGTLLFYGLLRRKLGLKIGFCLGTKPFYKGEDIRGFCLM